MIDVVSRQAATRDSLSNFAASLNAGQDKTTRDHFFIYDLTRAQVEAMYRGDWLARKVVDIVPYDMVREWREWSGARADIQAIEREERRLNYRKVLQRALTLGRLYGGAAIVIGTAEEDPAALARELDPAEISRGGIAFLHAVTRWQLNAPAIDRDPMSPYFGEAVAYEVVAPTRGALHLHPSRVIRFLGNEWPDPSVGASVWSDSVLQTLYDAIHAVALTNAGATSLMHEAKVDVVTVPNLSEHLASSATTAQLSARFSYAAAMKSINNLLLLGDGETWSRQTIDFTGLPEMVRTFLQVAAGAADIPVTRLLGQSPAGLSATGDSDTRNYYDMIAARQAIDLRPKLERLDDLILRSAGVDPAQVSFDFRPLWQMDAATNATVALNKAQTTQIYAGLKLWPDAVTARLVQSQLMEDGPYPAAEAIFAAATPPSGIVTDGGVRQDGGAGGVGSAGRQGQGIADLFDPNQPRDPDGRWTAGAGQGAAAVPSAGASQTGQTPQAAETDPKLAAAGTSTNSPDPKSPSEPSDAPSSLAQAVNRALSAINPISSASAQVIPVGPLLNNPVTRALIAATAAYVSHYIVSLGQEIYKHLPNWTPNTEPEPKPAGPAPNGAAAQSARPPETTAPAAGSNAAGSASTDPAVDPTEGYRPLTIRKKAVPSLGLQPASASDIPFRQQNSVANTLPGGYTSQSTAAGEKPGQAGQVTTSTAASGNPSPEPPEDPKRKQAQEKSRKELEDKFYRVKNNVLSDEDLNGAQKELQDGETFVWKNPETPFNHMEKVENGQTSLINIIPRCKNALKSINLLQSEIDPTVELLGKASRLLDKSRSFFPRGSSIEFRLPSPDFSHKVGASRAKICESRLYRTT